MGSGAFLVQACRWPADPPAGARSGMGAAGRPVPARRGPPPAPAAPPPPPAPPPASPAPAPSAEPAPAPAPAPPPPPPIMTEDPQAYNQCLTDLKAAGAQFTERPRIDDGDGCGIDKPLEVTEILPGVSLKPKATLRCAAALELSEWMRTLVIPAADQALPDKGRLTAVDQASSYICRNRNSRSDGKMSEHAKGNALDIAGFEFEKGDVPMKIVPDSEPTLPGAFQRTINSSACLYFTTVLAPGADETHKDHMHLDLIKRRNDYRVCQEPN
nr:extensin family protein [Agrobacterium vitis]